MEKIGLKKTWPILGVILFFYLGCIGLFFNISIQEISKFVIMNIISIFLPGIAILAFIRVKLSKMGAFFTSYLLGYAFLVVEYFLCEIFNRKISFALITFAVAILSLYILIRIYSARKYLIKFKQTGNEIIEILVLVLFLILNIFAYSANYLGTDVVPLHISSRDMAYWINNTVSLKLSWPADNLFMSGTALNYHYFSNIPIAFLSEVYKVDVFTLSFPLYGFTKAMVMVGAVSFLTNIISTNKRITLLAYILLLFTTGAETISYVTIVHHILLTPFGFDIGYGYGIFFVAFLIRQWKKEKVDWKNFIGMILAWGMCVGAKAPVASVLILMAALLCFYWLLQRQWLLSLGYGLPILGMFLLICKYCVGMFATIEGDTAWQLGMYGADHFTFMGYASSWDIIGQFMVLLGGKSPLIGLVFRTISYNPILIIGTIAVIICTICLVCKKTVSIKDAYLQGTLVLTATFGISLWHLINAGGASEMYFVMAAGIPLTVIILSFMSWHLEEERTLSFTNGGILKKGIFYFSFSLLLLYGVFRFTSSAYRESGAFVNAYVGARNLYEAASVRDYSNQIERGIRDTDVEALNWIRDNAEEDALIMTDKAIMTDNTAYYLYGIFCERQQYLEGTNMLGTFNADLNDEIARRKGIICAVYENKKDSIKIAKQEGIDYIVQTVDVTPDFIYNENLLELVESTNTMNIYKVK